MVNCRFRLMEGPCTVVIVVIVAINVLVTSNLQTFPIGGLALSLSQQQHPSRSPRPPKVRVVRRKETVSPPSTTSSIIPPFSQGRYEGNTTNRIKSQDSSFLSDVAFSDRRDDFHPLTLRALTEGMGLGNMTPVQTQTLGPALMGKSIMARARTGSGKTLVGTLTSYEIMFFC
jgi:ATP-dependent RNA helicase MSS116, mitochondrial